MSLLVLPLYIPVLIFGVAAVEASVAGLPARPHLMLLGAMLAAALPLAPWAAAAAAVLCIFYRQFNWEVFSGALRITVRITAMIMLIVAGGTMFTGAFAANGGAKLVQIARRQMEKARQNDSARLGAPSAD